MSSLLTIYFLMRCDIPSNAQTTKNMRGSFTSM